MRYGACYKSPDEDILWFRTGRPLATGFYRRHTRPGKPPDVYIAESVPELIMKVYPWIHKEEAAFQDQVQIPGSDAQNKNRLSDRLTDQLVQRLDPHDDAVWVDEPDWVNYLQPE
ncbi:MAG TPA: hypothetical protein VKB81_19760 [Nitrospira sp.]|nr:hypothetical protein [Nitrospira sp.]